MSRSFIACSLSAPANLLSSHTIVARYAITQTPPYPAWHSLSMDLALFYLFSFCLISSPSFLPVFFQLIFKLSQGLGRYHIHSSFLLVNAQRSHTHFRFLAWLSAGAFFYSSKVVEFTVEA